MIGHEVYQHSKTGTLGSLDKLFEFSHSRRRVHSQIRVNIIIISDGIGRACLTFDHTRIISGDPVSRIIRTMGVLNDTGVPHVCGAERLYGPKHGRRYAIEFSAAVLLYGAAWTAVVVEVGKQPWNKLIYNRFHGLNQRLNLFCLMALIVVR